MWEYTMHAGMPTTAYFMTLKGWGEGLHEDQVHTPSKQIEKHLFHYS